MSTKTTLATAACFDAKRHPHCRCGTTLDYATRSDRLVDHHRYREVGLQEVISAPDIDCGRMRLIDKTRVAASNLSGLSLDTSREASRLSATELGRGQITASQPLITFPGF